MIIAIAHFGQPLVQVKTGQGRTIFGILLSAICHRVIAKPSKMLKQLFQFLPLPLAHASTTVGVCPNHKYNK